MKNILCAGIILAIAIGLSSFNGGKKPPAGRRPPGRAYNLFYIDNSHVRDFESFSPNLLDVVSRKVDSVRDGKDQYIALFSSNGPKPDFVSSYKGAKNIIDKLSNGYTDNPFSPFDKSVVLERISTSDLSNVKAVNVYFFLTESYLATDLMKTNCGLLLNVLPKEIQYLLSGDEDKVNVFVYFPADSKQIKAGSILNFCNFSNSAKDLSAKIKYHVEPI